MELKNRLQELAGKWGDKKKLAAVTGADYTTVLTWFKGRMPEAPKLLKIAKHYNTSVEYLLTGHHPDSHQPALVMADSLDPEVRMNAEEYRAVPLVQGRVAAGAPTIVDEQVEGYAVVYAPLLGRRKDVVAVRVTGDSMDPLLPDGSMVIIDRKDKRIVKGKIYAVRDEDGVTIKYLRKEGDMLIMIPENREFLEVQISLKEQRESPIVGRMIWSWRSWE